MSKSCIGLDIGSSTIKLVQVRDGRGGARELVAFGIEPVPPHSIIDGAVADRAAVVTTLRTLYQRLHLRAREVAIAVAGSSVTVKKIAVPLMSPEELAEQIPWEAEQHIPFPRDDVELDYQLLDPKNAMGQMEVLLVAARKVVVRDYAAVAEAANLHPVVMDVAAFALQNAFEIAYPGVAVGVNGAAAALVNVGATTTTINILTGEATGFTRDVPIGAAVFTDELKRVLHVDDARAEALLAQITTEESPELIDLVRPIADQLAGEFCMSLDFFLTCNPGSAISKIYLAGGGARLALLHHALAAQAHVPVEVMNPFRGMQRVEGAAVLDRRLLERHAAQAAIAVGLALRAPGDKPA